MCVCKRDRQTKREKEGICVCVRVCVCVCVCVEGLLSLVKTILGENNTVHAVISPLAFLAQTITISIKWPWHMALIKAHPVQIESCILYFVIHCVMVD